MYTFYCTNLSMSIDVLAEMMDRPDLREFFAVSQNNWSILNVSYVASIDTTFFTLCNTTYDKPYLP